jgi:alanine dehydrogenase
MIHKQYNLYSVDPQKGTVCQEIKNNENRVAITPAGAHALINEGHTVMVKYLAGFGSRITSTLLE